ncbi:STAS domain-containing protein [Halobacillus sp. A5]|uniref:STAS domain-containing protein n=1 Tax=Halobacillus sp. A5 TaxID=2880263 RepID=UPI0020A670AA|nr:STAS domain-containing protein [Halobacillus sp. A5]MCP3028231.1 STAS domain-containing protein [Halobacillus sp. A5]
MKQADRAFPLPYYKINKNFTVQTYSEEAFKLWGNQENLLHIIDEESIEKVKKWISPDIHKSSVEAHLKPVNGGNDPLTADVYTTWNNDLYAEVILMMKDDKLNRVTKTLNQLRSRLNDTNFELLEEKEKLEEAIDQNNKLSAPFIELTLNTALIPLFGDITSDKFHTVEEGLLHASQKEDIDRLLFDFTAVGEIHREGIHVLTDMMTSLFYMGTEIIVIGVKPQQAKQLHELNLPLNVQFIHSLQQAVAKYCT